MYDEGESQSYSLFPTTKSKFVFKKRYLLVPLCIAIVIVVIVVAVVETSKTKSSSPITDFCVPGEKCFPNVKELNKFNKSVNGRFFAERPAGSVCYRGDPSFDVELCKQYSLNSSSGTFRYEHFPTYQYVNYEYCGLSNCSARSITNEGTCDQGSVPLYSVHAETTEDVQQYVKFATHHNLRIVVKNTGHDLLGRSSGKNGFAVWTHKLKSIIVHDQFKPKGCKINYEKAISVGAGVQWEEAYAAIHPYGRVVVGGLAVSVGSAGGWVLGGGHSFLTPSYGLGADNLIEVEIVTADGEIRRVSECSNSDLFWALRGGGGGTWGVVTQVTYKTHPASTLYTATISLEMDIQNTTFLDMLTLWIKTAPVIGDLGVGGAAVLSPSSLGAVLVLPAEQSSWVSFKEALQPFATWMSQQNVGSLSFTNYTSWFAFYMENYWQADIPAGTPGGTSSRIIPRQYYENNPEKMAAVFLESLKYKVTTNNYYPVIIGLAAPVKLRDGPIATSVNPIWYDSLWHVVTDPSFVNQLRILAPDAAVYFGESDVDEPNYAGGYWGVNYDRLLKVKDKWDPKNNFQVWHGVGTTYQNNAWDCYS